MLEVVATIKPQHLKNIRGGKKLWEIRKTIPRGGVPFKVYCCESGSGGQVVAEFVVGSELCIRNEFLKDFPNTIKESCVTYSEVLNYSNGKRLYFWRIHNMIDYKATLCREVRHISEFGLTRPPQSWCYVKGR